MDKKTKIEKFCSRRKFLKQTAKVALPFVIGVVIASNPIVAKAASSCKTCKGGCGGTCYGACTSTCKGGCQTTCTSCCKNYGCTGVNKK